MRRHARSLPGSAVLLQENGSLLRSIVRSCRRCCLRMGAGLRLLAGAPVLLSVGRFPARLATLENF